MAMFKSVQIIIVKSNDRNLSSFIQSIISTLAISSMLCNFLGLTIYQCNINAGRQTILLPYCKADIFAVVVIKVVVAVLVA